MAYVVSSNSYTWFSASQYCSEVVGTQLATIRNAYDLQQVQNAFGQWSTYWVGLSNLTDSGLFSWQDGSPLTINTNINLARGNEDHCGAIYDDSLQVQSCGNLYPALCDANKKYIVVPEAMTWADAEEFCTSTYGTNLATLVNANDVALLPAFTDQPYWLGMSRTGNNFTWISGLKSSITYQSTTSGDCLGTWPNTKYSNLPCGLAFPFLCDPIDPDHVLTGQILNWYDSQAYCMNTFGSNLASIPNLNSSLALPTSAAGWSWIGINFKFSNTHFIDNSTITFFNWSPLASNASSCALVKQDKMWYRYDCGQFKTNAVCNTAPAMNSRYRVVELPMTWIEAEAYCLQTFNTHLATINSVEDTYMLPGYELTWVGLNNLNNDQTFTWSSGASAKYTNWFAGNPSYSTEQCTFVSENKAWQTTDCDGVLLHSLCDAPPPIKYTSPYKKPNQGTSEHNYKVVNMQTNWGSGEKYCASKYHSHLATVTDGADLNKITSLVKALNLTDSVLVWVGLSGKSVKRPSTDDYESYGKNVWRWIWESGTKYTMKSVPWVVDQPPSASDEECAVYVVGDYGITATNCDDDALVVCDA